jgi:hypothetical protein
MQQVEALGANEVQQRARAPEIGEAIRREAHDPHAAIAKRGLGLRKTLSQRDHRELDRARIECFGERVLQALGASAHVHAVDHLRYAHGWTSVRWLVVAVSIRASGIGRGATGVADSPRTAMAIPASSQKNRG